MHSSRSSASSAPPLQPPSTRLSTPPPWRSGAFSGTRSRVSSTTPRLTSITPRLTSITPSLTSSTPRLSNPTPSLSNATSRLSNVPPRLISSAPRLSKATPRLSNATSKLRNVPPRLTSSTPRLSDASPRLSNATPRLSNTTPQLSTAAAMPRVSSNTPQLSFEPASDKMLIQSSSRAQGESHTPPSSSSTPLVSAHAALHRPTTQSRDSTSTIRMNSVHLGDDDGLLPDVPPEPRGAYWSSYTHADVLAALETRITVGAHSDVDFLAPYLLFGLPSIVKAYFDRYNLPQLPISQRAWSVLLLDFERTTFYGARWQDHLKWCLDFLNHLCTTVYRLATGRASPTLVAPCVYTCAELRETADWATACQPHLLAMKDVRESWNRPEVTQLFTTLFNDVDADNDGVLQWKNGEIIHFATQFFLSLHMPAPSCPDAVWYQLYRDIDADNTLVLNKTDVVQFTFGVLKRTILVCEFELEERGKVKQDTAELVVGVDDRMNGRYWEPYADPTVLTLLEAYMAVAIDQEVVDRISTAAPSDIRLSAVVTEYFRSLHLPPLQMSKASWLVLIRDFTMSREQRDNNDARFVEHVMTTVYGLASNRLLPVMVRPGVYTCIPRSEQTLVDWYQDFIGYTDALKNIVATWDKVDTKNKVLAAFSQATNTTRDMIDNAALQWENNEIEDFIKIVLADMGLPVARCPRSVWYQLYAEFDAWQLNSVQAIRFAAQFLRRVCAFFPDGGVLPRNDLRDSRVIPLVDDGSDVAAEARRRNAELIASFKDQHKEQKLENTELRDRLQQAQGEIRDFLQMLQAAHMDLAEEQRAKEQLESLMLHSVQQSEEHQLTLDKALANLGIAQKESAHARKQLEQEQRMRTQLHEQLDRMEETEENETRARTSMTSELRSEVSARIQELTEQKKCAQAKADEQTNSICAQSIHIANLQEELSSAQKALIDAEKRANAELWGEAAISLQEKGAPEVRSDENLFSGGHDVSGRIEECKRVLDSRKQPALTLENEKDSLLTDTHAQNHFLDIQHEAASEMQVLTEQCARFTEESEVLCESLSRCESANDRKNIELAEMIAARATMEANAAVREEQLRVAAERFSECSALASASETVAQSHKSTIVELQSKLRDVSSELQLEREESFGLSLHLTQRDQVVKELLTTNAQYQMLQDALGVVQHTEHSAQCTAYIQEADQRVSDVKREYQMSLEDEKRRHAVLAEQQVAIQYVAEINDMYRAKESQDMEIERLRQRSEENDRTTRIFQEQVTSAMSIISPSTELSNVATDSASMRGATERHLCLLTETFLHKYHAHANLVALLRNALYKYINSECVVTLNHALLRWRTLTCRARAVRVLLHRRDRNWGLIDDRLLLRHFCYVWRAWAAENARHSERKEHKLQFEMRIAAREQELEVATKARERQLLQQVQELELEAQTRLRVAKEAEQEVAAQMAAAAYERTQLYDMTLQKHLAHYRARAIEMANYIVRFRDSNLIILRRTFDQWAASFHLEKAHTRTAEKEAQIIEQMNTVVELTRLADELRASHKSRSIAALSKWASSVDMISLQSTFTAWTDTIVSRDQIARSVEFGRRVSFIPHVSMQKLFTVWAAATSTSPPVKTAKYVDLPLRWSISVIRYLLKIAFRGWVAICSTRVHHAHPKPLAITYASSLESARVDDASNMRAHMLSERRTQCDWKTRALAWMHRNSLSLNAQVLKNTFNSWLQHALRIKLRLQRNAHRLDALIKWADTVEASSLRLTFFAWAQERLRRSNVPLQSKRSISSARGTLGYEHHRHALNRNGRMRVEQAFFLHWHLAVREAVDLRNRSEEVGFEVRELRNFWKRKVQRVEEERDAEQRRLEEMSVEAGKYHDLVRTHAGEMAFAQEQANKHEAQVEEHAARHRKLMHEREEAWRTALRVESQVAHNTTEWNAAKACMDEQKTDLAGKTFLAPAECLSVTVGKLLAENEKTTRISFGRSTLEEENAIITLPRQLHGEENGERLSLRKPVSGDWDQLADAQREVDAAWALVRSEQATAEEARRAIEATAQSVALQLTEIEIDARKLEEKKRMLQMSCAEYDAKYLELTELQSLHDKNASLVSQPVTFETADMHAARDRVELVAEKKAVDAPLRRMHAELEYERSYLKEEQRALEQVEQQLLRAHENHAHACDEMTQARTAALEELKAEQTTMAVQLEVQARQFAHAEAQLKAEIEQSERQSHVERVTLEEALEHLEEGRKAQMDEKADVEAECQALKEDLRVIAEEMRRLNLDKERRKLERTKMVARMEALRKENDAARERQNELDVTLASDRVRETELLEEMANYAHREAALKEELAHELAECEKKQQLLDKESISSAALKSDYEHKNSEIQVKHKQAEGVLQTRLIALQAERDEERAQRADLMAQLEEHKQQYRRELNANVSEMDVERQNLRHEIDTLKQANLLMMEEKCNNEKFMMEELHDAVRSERERGQKESQATLQAEFLRLQKIIDIEVKQQVEQVERTRLEKQREQIQQLHDEKTLEMQNIKREWHEEVRRTQAEHAQMSHTFHEEREEMGRQLMLLQSDKEQEVWQMRRELEIELERRQVEQAHQRSELELRLKDVEQMGALREKSLLQQQQMEVRLCTLQGRVRRLERQRSRLQSAALISATLSAVLHLWRSAAMTRKVHTALAHRDECWRAVRGVQEEMDIVQGKMEQMAAQHELLVRRGVDRLQVRRRHVLVRDVWHRWVEFLWGTKVRKQCELVENRQAALTLTEAMALEEKERLRVDTATRRLAVMLGMLRRRRLMLGLQQLGTCLRRGVFIARALDGLGDRRGQQAVIRCFGAWARLARIRRKQFDTTIFALADARRRIAQQLEKKCARLRFFYCWVLNARALVQEKQHDAEKICRESEACRRSLDLVRISNVHLNRGKRSAERKWVAYHVSILHSALSAWVHTVYVGRRVPRDSHIEHARMLCQRDAFLEHRQKTGRGPLASKEKRALILRCFVAWLQFLAKVRGDAELNRLLQEKDSHILRLEDRIAECQHDDQRTRDAEGQTWTREVQTLREDIEELVHVRDVYQGCPRDRLKAIEKWIMEMREEAQAHSLRKSRTQRSVNQEPIGSR